jgi:hypothetical protein
MLMRERCISRAWDALSPDIGVDLDVFEVDVTEYLVQPCYQL